MLWNVKRNNSDKVEKHLFGLKMLHDNSASNSIRRSIERIFDWLTGLGGVELEEEDETKTFLEHDCW